jgi:hypothetical protein
MRPRACWLDVEKTGTMGSDTYSWIPASTLEVRVPRACTGHWNQDPLLVVTIQYLTTTNVRSEYPSIEAPSNIQTIIIIEMP